MIILLLVRVSHNFRQIFCDFGKDFIVVDNDGETPVTCMISAVTQVWYYPNWFNVLLSSSRHSFNNCLHRTRRVWSLAWKRQGTVFKLVTTLLSLK